MNSKVIDNGFDFIIRAADDFWNDKLTSEQQLKYSTIELFEGIELILKARLIHEHWSLVVKDVDKFKKGAFEKGDFVSVYFDEAWERLKKICNLNLSDKAYEAFENLRELRNRYVHFVCNQSYESVLAVQVQAWHHIISLLENRFLSLNAQQKELLEVARDKMIRLEEVLNMRYEEAKPTIEKAKKSGNLIVACPFCLKQSLIIGDGEPSCPVCVSELDYASAADSYARSINIFWKHPKHGPDDEIAWCENCGEQAIVAVGEDLLEEAKGRLPQIPCEPGKDWEVYICFSCAQPAIDWWLRECGVCGAKYFDSSGTAGCPACDS